MDLLLPLLPLVGRVLFLLFPLLLDGVEVDDYLHLVPLLGLLPGLLLGHLFEGVIDKGEDVGDLLLLLGKLSHDVENLLFELLVAVGFGHLSPLEFLLDLLEPVLEEFAFFCFLAVALLLLVLVDGDEDADGLPAEFVPGVPAGVLLDEDGDDVVLLEGVVLALLLLSALVHEVVLLLQLLGAAAVVAGEPLDVGVEAAQPFEDVPALLGGEFLEGPPLLVVLDLAEGDNRHKVVVEYPVYLNPLQSDLVVVAADFGGQLFPEVLRNEETLVLLQLQLQLEGVQLFAVVEAVLENLQALVVLSYVLEPEPFELSEDSLEVLDGLGLLVKLGELELEFDSE